MSEELLRTEERDGFVVRYYAGPEDDSPEDSFGEEILADVVEGIASGRYLWFYVHVTASKAGVVLGEDYLGGCCYESLEAFLTPDWYATDMRDAVIAEAKAKLEELTRG